MNEQDKKAFEEWNKLPVDQILSPTEYREFLKNMYEFEFTKKAWEAACKYKQKEIDELQEQNKKLRECVEFYADNNQWEGREIDGSDWHDYYEDGNGIGGFLATMTLKGLNNEQ